MAKAGILKDVKSRTGTKDNNAVSHTVKDIPIGDIHIKENIRKEYTGLEELQASIREHGLILPITVYEEGDGYVVKTGHRRFKATQALFKTDPDKFNRIRCFITNADNIVVFQLIENIQRVDLSQIDLCNALTALKNERMTNKQIAEILGKSEGHIKNLFMGINEIAKDEELKNLVSHCAVTLKEVAETRSISNRQKRLDLLKKRGKREITQSEMIMRGRSTKKGNPAAELSDAVSDCPATQLQVSTGGMVEAQVDVLDPLAIEEMVPLDTADAVYDSRKTPETGKIQISVERQPGQASILVSLIKGDNKHSLSVLEKDLRAYFGQLERYRLVNDV
jgi:ParB family chromosome partitioning protein